MRRWVPLAAGALLASLGVGIAAFAPWRREVVIIPDLEISRAVNEKPAVAPAAPAPVKNAAPLRIAPGDTVSIDGITGRVTEITTQKIYLRSWTGKAWGEPRSFDRKEAEPISTAISMRAESTWDGVPVLLDVKAFKQGGDASTSVRVWHRASDKILVKAKVKLGEETAEVGPLLAGVEGELYRPGDPWARVASIAGAEFVPITSAGGKKIIVAQLAQATAMFDVLADAAAVNGDPELALVLAGRPESLDERDVLERVFAKFGGPAASALLDHVLLPNERYKVLEARTTGDLTAREPRTLVLTTKARELALLARIPDALAAGRAQKLIELYESTTLLRREALAVANEHVGDFLDYVVRLDDTGRSRASEIIAKLDAKSLRELVRRRGQVSGAFDDAAILLGDVEAIRDALAAIRLDLSSRPKTR
jgi:hypothetical protein